MNKVFFTFIVNLVRWHYTYIETTLCFWLLNLPAACHSSAASGHQVYDVWSQGATFNEKYMYKGTFSIKQ